MLRNTKISTRLIAMAAVPIVLIALLAAVTLVLVRQVSINSPAYDRIITSKNFVAEVQTPRLFLIEANMGVNQLAQPEANPGDRAAIQEAVDRSRIDYEDAFNAWNAQITDTKEREYLLQSDELAKAYFAMYDRVVRLQSENKNKAALTLVQGDMATQFLLHKSAIENVVGIANAHIQAEEAAAASTTRKQLAILAVSVIILIALTAALGFNTVRSITSRIRRLRHVAVVELPEVIENVKKSTLAGEEIPTYRPIELGGHDELTDATHAFNVVLGTAVDLASQQSRLRRSTSEMFVNLGRRNHKLLSRTLSYISELERDERDPATLQKLFKLDHLATRMRRHAESLLVLAGSAPLRTWSRPVPVADVLRAGLSEIEAYDRVDVSSLEPIAIKGSVVSDLAHLMAELLENATTFSPPETRIRILGRGGSEGYTLVVVDEGVGMKPEVMATANRLIAAAERDDSATIGDARMLGLGVVGRLAARHGLSVNLGASPMGGVVAWVVLPPALLSPLADAGSSAGSAPVTAVEVTAEDAPRSAAPSAYAPTAIGGPPPISQPIPIDAQPAAEVSPPANPAPAAPAAPMPVAGPPASISPPAQRPSPDIMRPPAPSRFSTAGLDAVINGSAAAIREEPKADVTEPLGAAPSESDAPTQPDAARSSAPAAGSPNGTLPQRRPGANDGAFGDPVAPSSPLTSASPFLAFHPRVQPTPGSEEPFRAAELFTPAKGVPAAPDFSDNPYTAVAVAEPEQGIGAPLRKRVRGAQMPEASDPVVPESGPKVSDRTADSVRSALSSFVSGQRSATQTTPSEGVAASTTPTAPTAPRASTSDVVVLPDTGPSVTGPNAADSNGTHSNGTHSNGAAPNGLPSRSGSSSNGSSSNGVSSNGVSTNRAANGASASSGAAAGVSRVVPAPVHVSTTTTAVDGLAVSLPISPLTPGVTLGTPSTPPSIELRAAEPNLTASGLRRRVRGAQLPEMALPPAPARPADRTAESVRTALANFTAGRRSAAEPSD